MSSCGMDKTKHNFNWFYGSNSQSESSIKNGNGNPFTNSGAGDYTLKAATNVGTNLGSPYNVDMNGNARTTWTRGALEYGGTPPPTDTTPPAAPTGLAVS